MKKYLILFAVLTTGFASAAQDLETDGLDCTSIAVGRLASADGSVITSHTCDGKSRTWLTCEPAAKHPKGTMHSVYRGSRHVAFPGDTTGLRKLGEIPEAHKTFAYLNTAYPSLNEKQVAIGETTFSGPDTLRSSNGIFMVEELCRLALQRCGNARDAVKLMGSLAEKYGYVDSGECLTVADKKEVWFFEILGPGKGETGAVWAAQRVPDGEVAVSANIPRIGRIDRGDKRNFMASDNVESVALKYGLWDGQGDFFFYKAYHGKYGAGKNFREREWWILNELAPSLGLKYEDDEMPFSVKPEKPVSVRDVMQLLRSTYEGVEGFDMCANIKLGDKISPLANPWPTTNYQKTINTIAPGTITFRRTVAVAWCAYSTVIQLRDWLPDAVGGICWLAVDNPAQSPHIPIFAGCTELPVPMSACGQKRYDPGLFVWQFRKANKLATLSWQTTKEEFNKVLAEVEDDAFEGLPGPKARSEDLNAYTRKVYDNAAARWAELEAKYWVQFGRGF
jgi:dipeptidase